jgi:Flp pilus assembly protein TadG
MRSSSARNYRRGTNAIEFALTIPVCLALVIGIIEFGWFFWQKSTTIDAVRQGCRAGSLYADAPTDGSFAATDVAYDEMTHRLTTTNLCGGSCVLSAYTSRVGATDFLFCNAEVEYQSITGFLPPALLPEYSKAEAFVRMEVQ